MNAILGFTEILKRGYVKNEADSLKYLNTIHSSGKNLLELINDILDLSKVESGRMEIAKVKVAPYTTIHEIIQMLNVKAEEKGITLAFRADGPLPQEIETDPVRLRQIIFNLIGNAIKFTEKGGVTVTCRYIREQSDPKWIIDISDTGIGISARAAETIFDPFVQADASITGQFGGTGLGLAISHRFARALGGDLTVESELGKGSLFRLSLDPGELDGVEFLQPDAVARFEPESDRAEQVRWHFQHASVLVVDDGVENRELIKLLLADAGLSVEEAENGQQAVEKAEVGDYSVILMDVKMPVMDGFTAVKILREKGLEIPIIALTANAMSGYEDECLAAGYSGYLSKPISIDRFMDLMAQLLDGKKCEGDSNVKPVPSDDQVKVEEDPQTADSGPIYSDLPLHIEKFKKIVYRFVIRLDEQLDAMEQAAAHGDLNEVAGLAHWLKGAGGTVGFKVFTEPAAQLEIQAKNGDGPQVDTSLAHLRTLAARLVVDQPPALDGSAGKTVPDEKHGNENRQEAIKAVGV
jgi:CheY-like chemotaxis protein